MIDPNWTRWIVLSLAKHFKTKTDPISFFVEGENQKTADKQDYIEFRMNGPNIRNVNGFYKFDLVVNILIVCKQTTTSILPIHNHVGIVAAAFTKFIPLYRLGPDTAGVDDASFWNCLLIHEREKKEVDISHIGQINPDLPEMQAMVQGFYHMLLEI